VDRSTRIRVSDKFKNMGSEKCIGNNRVILIPGLTLLVGR
jgi:hypothetical protein